MDEFNDMGFQSSDIGMSSDMGSDIVTDMGADMDTEINSDMNSSVDMAINTELNSDLNTEMDEPEADIDFEALEDQPIVTASETEEMEKKVEEINQEDERDELEEIQKEQINETEEQKEEQEEVKGYLDDDNIWHGDKGDEPLYGKDGELRDLNEEEVPLEEGELDEIAQRENGKEIDQEDERNELEEIQEEQINEIEEQINEIEEQINEIEEQKEEQEEVKGYLDDDNIWHGDEGDEPLYGKDGELRDLNEEEVPLKDGELGEIAQTEEEKEIDQEDERYESKEIQEEQINEIDEQKEEQEEVKGYLDDDNIWHGDEGDEPLYGKDGELRDLNEEEVPLKDGELEEYVPYEETDEYKNKIAEDAETEDIRQGFIDHLREYNTNETNEQIARQEKINQNSDVKQENEEKYINYDETQEYKDIIKEKSEKEGEKLHKGFLNHLKKWNKK